MYTGHTETNMIQSFNKLHSWFCSMNDISHDFRLSLIIRQTNQLDRDE